MIYDLIAKIRENHISIAIDCWKSPEMMIINKFMILLYRFIESVIKIYKFSKSFDILSNYNILKYKFLIIC